MSRSSRRQGFTLIELAVTLGVIATIAALAIGTVNAVQRRGTLAYAHHTVAQAFDQAKSYSYSRANDIVFVIVGNDTPVNAAKCGAGTFQPMLDNRCVRYWILEDIVSTGPPGPPPSTKFDDNALAAFTPANPAAAGDVLLASGYLGKGVMIGTAPNYAPVAPVAGSIFEGMTLSISDMPCSFCRAGTPPRRGFIRFGADGQVKMGNEAAFPKSRIGGFIGFTGYDTGGTQIPSTNWVAISVPAGLVTERFSSSEK